MKVLGIVLACMAVSVMVGGGVYWWYRVEGKDLIKQVQEADNKPFFF